jgi:Na+:H+ antiporter, NhaA family
MSDIEQTSSPKFPVKPIDAIATPFQRFVHTESAGGGVLLLAAITALVIANSAFGPSFESFWTTTVGLRFGATVWEHSLRHWINDGLVTLFFFVVGLEIKRELVSGELSEPRVAALPVIAAAGGMVVPAALYLALASGPQAGRGWGVVMATDIAFVVGCLALLGSRVPNSLKIFVLALAIIDDIGAILVIALGYSHAFHAMPLAGALLGLGITVLMQWLGVRAVMAYWLVGLLTWAALHESGIHPTIAGVALGLLTPVTALVDPNRLDWFLTWARHAAPVALEETEAKPKAVRQRLARAVKESISPQQRLEAGVHPWSAFFVLPVFALANAGVAISIASAFNPITLAIIVGLTVGKPLRIFAFAWFAVEFGLARKPEDITWLMLLAAGLLAGIGFTMALFIANLAFQGDALEAAKLGILTASLISGVVGMVLLRTLSVKKSSSC